jgi:hypothetical protein
MPSGPGLSERPGAAEESLLRGASQLAHRILTTSHAANNATGANFAPPLDDSSRDYRSNWENLNLQVRLSGNPVHPLGEFLQSGPLHLGGLFGFQSFGLRLIPSRAGALLVSHA